MTRNMSVVIAIFAVIAAVSISGCGGGDNESCCPSSTIVASYWSSATGEWLVADNLQGPAGLWYFYVINPPGVNTSGGVDYTFIVADEQGKIVPPGDRCYGLDPGSYIVKAFVDNRIVASATIRVFP